MNFDISGFSVQNIFAEGGDKRGGKVKTDRSAR